MTLGHLPYLCCIPGKGALSRSCADRERANCCGLYAKRQLMVPATIIATYSRDNIQWGKKVFSQPPIVQVLPIKKMREACNFHHRYTSTMRDKIRKKKSRKSHCRIFNEFICKLWWKISIWSITKFHLNTLLYTLCWQ